jgi:hypothetical protein
MYPVSETVSFSRRAFRRFLETLLGAVGVLPRVEFKCRCGALAGFQRDTMSESVLSHFEATIPGLRPSYRGLQPLCHKIVSLLEVHPEAPGNFNPCSAWASRPRTHNGADERRKQPREEGDSIHLDLILERVDAVPNHKRHANHRISNKKSEELDSRHCAVRLPLRRS